MVSLVGTLTLTLILGVFAALLMAAALGHQIGRPLVMLAEGVRRVARGDLSRTDGLPLQPPVTPGHLAGPPGEQEPAVQLSRRTRGDASRQTAGQKITKVISWLRELP